MWKSKFWIFHASRCFFCNVNYTRRLYRESKFWIFVNSFIFISQRKLSKIEILNLKALWTVFVFFHIRGSHWKSKFLIFTPCKRENYPKSKFLRILKTALRFFLRLCANYRESWIVKSIRFFFCAYEKSKFWIFHASRRVFVLRFSLCATITICESRKSKFSTRREGYSSYVSSSMQLKIVKVIENRNFWISKIS